MSETDRIARAYQELALRGGAPWDQANPGNRSILFERRRATKIALGRAGWLPLDSRRILDVGSGSGSELASLQELGAAPGHLCGVDLLPERVAYARRTYPEIDFRQGNAEHLDFEDSSFDLVLAMTVFSSIFDESMSRNVAGEITRVLKPGGGLLWYDMRYDSISNRNVHAVRGRRVHELFKDLKGELFSITLVPPLARRLGPFTAAAYPALEMIPPLRSHLFGLLRKP